MGSDDSGESRVEEHVGDLPDAGEQRAVLAAFEHAPGPLLLAEGEDLMVTAVNEAARDQYGVCVGEPLDLAFPEPSGPALADRAHEVLLHGETQTCADWRFEVEQADGPRVSYLSVRLAAWCGPDGEPRGVVVQGVDVTDAVRARQATAARAADRERRAQAARDTLVTLQDALLPEGLPIPPGVDLAARYLFAEDQAKAGGDWFDAVALDDGRVVLVVGDVVGHGVRASVVMGELRTLFEERVREDGDLAAALRLLDNRASRMTQARATTLCAAVIEPASGAVTYCTAGHPPPLVVSAEGEPAFLPVTGSGPLGSGLPLAFAEHTLGDGDALLVYSDGLVERPGRSPVQNTLDLARVAQDVALRHDPLAATGRGARFVDQLSREVVEVLTHDAGFDDDITVLVAQRVSPPEPLEMTVPAFPDTLRAARQALGEWLGTVGIAQLDEIALQHAVGELVSNAVEHAYPADVSRQDAVVTVRAALRPGGVIEVEVADRGTWRAPGPARGRGRGLAMASGFSDELEVTHDERGTRAVLRQRPSAPVDLLTGAGSAGVPPHPPMQLSDDDGVVEITGALDQRSSDELRRRLAHASRGGTSDVVVDLSGVTLLGSAGVQVLFEELVPGRRSTDHAGLRLVAPPGSPAQHVLEMVRLPYAVDRDAAGR